MTNFQIILSVVFGLAFLIAVAIFAGVIKTPEKGNDPIAGASGTVVWWGTVDSGKLREPLEKFNFNKDYSVRYVEKDADTFNAELIEALASGKGPDVILVPPTLIAQYKNKAYLIPYEAYSERVYRDSFIPASELYLMKDGIVALPFLVDPLVLYYNKDMFVAKGIVNYPKTWDEVADIVPILVEKGASGTINRAAIALGTLTNVTHGKEILASLLLQVGNPIIGYDRATDIFYSALKGENGTAPGTESALKFFTDFTNPTLSLYSWNSALPSSQNTFIAGDLAMYIGFASELPTIRAKNPNLNFDLAPLPQSSAMLTKTTYGNIEGLMVMSASQNRNTAYVVSALLTGAEFQKSIEPTLLLPPVRRDLLSARPTDPSYSVFYDQALITKSWIDPDSATTTTILNTLIRNISTGIYAVPQALGLAHEQLSLFLD